MEYSFSMKRREMPLEEDDEYISPDFTDDGDEEIERDEIDPEFEDLGIDVDEGEDV